MAIVRIHDSNKVIELDVGSRLSRVSGILDTRMPCHVGQCGTCVFRVLHGKEALEAADRREQRRLENVNAPEDGRLLCRTKIAAEGEIEVAKYDRSSIAVREAGVQQMDPFSGMSLPDRVDDAST